jgi:AraC-like DNA-binding protein
MAGCSRRLDLDAVAGWFLVERTLVLDRAEDGMSSGEIVRFWQPAPEAGTDFIAACLAAGRSMPHVHSEWQFAVVEMPTGLSVGAFRRFAARADTVTVLPPLTVHTEGAGSGAGPGWRVLYVAPAVIGRLSGPHGDDAGRVVRFPAPVFTDPVRAAELRELLRESDEGLVGGAEFMSRALAWLEQVLREHALVLPDATRSSAVERARALLHSRPTQSLELPEIATVAGTSVSHLVRSFSRVVGLPPQRYHVQVRLAHARRLLAEGQAASWVAYECGFADQSHLNRRFKEAHGLTPGAFQIQYQAKASRVDAAA